MIDEMDNRVWRATNAALRFVLAKQLVPFAGRHVLVNEYPKSGGTWLTEMLAEAFDLPFPQHRLPSFGPSMLQGHYLSKTPLVNTVILFRDGRDVINSFYFHLVVGNEYSSKELSSALRERLSIGEPADVKTYLPRFIEYMCQEPSFPRFTWAQFVETWLGRPDTVEVTYEALRTDTAIEIRRIVRERAHLEISAQEAERIADRHSMKKSPKSQNSFRRKGVPGDWRNTFSQEAVEVFKHYNSAALIELGYEEDTAWGL